MIQCKFCQRTFPEGKRPEFCPGCGALLPAPEKGEAADAVPLQPPAAIPWEQAPRADSSGKPVRWGKFAIGWTAMMALCLVTAVSSMGFGESGLFVGLLLSGILMAQRRVYRRRGAVNLLSLTRTWEAVLSCFCLTWFFDDLWGYRYASTSWVSLMIAFACFYPAWKRLKKLKKSRNEQAAVR